MWNWNENCFFHVRRSLRSLVTLFGCLFETPEAITDALPGLINSAMPKLPSATGGAIPTGGMTGPDIRLP